MLPDYNYSSLLFNKYDLKLTVSQFENLETYAQFLVEYNEKVNLTAITKGEDILIKHFLDSILITKYVDIPENARIIDIGTGAGFPSVPIKIYRPDVQITLLDSLNKRIVFLRLLCEKLKIEAKFIHGRAEDYGKNTGYREKYDVSCARAVAKIDILSEFCVPFVRVGGFFIAMKSNEDIHNSNNVINMLGADIKDDIKYDIEGNLRRLIIIEKISQTSTKYPRNSSHIKKNPL